MEIVEQAQHGILYITYNRRQVNAPGKNITAVIHRQAPGVLDSIGSRERCNPIIPTV
jgi:hypothetical protein